MAKGNKASEEAMGNLHGVLAMVITSMVEQEEYCTEIVDGEIVTTDERQYVATPSLISVAVKFLKDNSITSDIQVDKNMSKLAEALAKKQKHSRLNDGTRAALKEVV